MDQKERGERGLGGNGWDRTIPRPRACVGVTLTPDPPVEISDTRHVPGWPAHPAVGRTAIPNFRNGSSSRSRSPIPMSNSSGISSGREQHNSPVNRRPRSSSAQLPQSKRDVNFPTRSALQTGHSGFRNVLACISFTPTTISWKFSARPYSSSARRIIVRPVDVHACRRPAAPKPFSSESTTSSAA